MSGIYHDGNRQLQNQFDTRRLADRLDEAIVQDSIMPSDKDFIERLDMFFIATVDERGHANCSYKAGDPGFVRVLDEHTLAFPITTATGCTHDGRATHDAPGGIAVHRLQNQAHAANGEPRWPGRSATEYPEAQFISACAHARCSPTARATFTR
jgi:hypothetical protein